jgi:hypothetical protein
VKVTPLQKHIVASLQNGCYISTFTDLAQNETTAELLDGDGNNLQDVRWVTVQSLIDKGLLVGVQHNEATHHYTLNAQKWQYLQTERRGGAQPNSGRPPKPKGEAQTNHIPGARWSEKDPTYQMLLQLTAKERKDCFSLLRALCCSKSLSGEQVELFEKIRLLEL